MASAVCAFVSGIGSLLNLVVEMDVLDAGLIPAREVTVLAIDCDKHSTNCVVCEAGWNPPIECDNPDCGLKLWALCPCADINGDGDE